MCMCVCVCVCVCVHDFLLRTDKFYFVFIDTQRIRAACALKNESRVSCHVSLVQRSLALELLEALQAQPRQRRQRQHGLRSKSTAHISSKVLTQ